MLYEIDLKTFMEIVYVNPAVLTEDSVILTAGPIGGGYITGMGRFRMPSIAVDEPLQWAVLCEGTVAPHNPRFSIQSGVGDEASLSFNMPLVPASKAWVKSTVLPQGRKPYGLVISYNSAGTLRIYRILLGDSESIRKATQGISPWIIISGIGALILLARRRK